MNEQPTEGMKFHGFLEVLRRRITIVIACLVLVPGIALAYTATQPKKYSASASILLEDAGFENSVVSNVSAPTPSAQDIATEIDTTVTVASLPTIAKNTAAKVGQGVTAGEIASGTTVAPAGSGKVLTVTSTDTKPRRAAQIATAYAGEFVAFERSMLRARVLKARDNLARQAVQTEAQYRSLIQRSTGSQADKAAAAALRKRLSDLQSREGDLTALAAVQTGNATVVQPATAPGSPTSPNPLRNVIAGIGLGLLLGVGLAVLFELLDRRLTKPEDVESLFGRPIVGAIPHSSALASSEPKALPPGDRESFRMLQTKMSYFNDDRPVKSVVVTSAASGDGKSTVAWNVAAAAAEAGGRVLLLEADLRNPNLASRFDIAVDKGLSDVLASRSELTDVVHHVPVGGHGHNGHRVTSFMDVVFAGRRPANPSQLIESRRMLELIRGCQLAYDLVVIDTPPPSIVSDAIPIIKLASGVLVVTRLRKSTRTEVSHLRDQLRNLNAVTLGVVINSTETGDGYYGATYGAVLEYEEGEVIEGTSS